MNRVTNEHIYKAIKFVHDEYDSPVRVLTSLGAVSHQGYYKWLNRTNNDNDVLNEFLCGEIQRLFKLHKGNPGSKQMVLYLNVDLKPREKINRKRVLRLMKILGLRSDIRVKKVQRKKLDELFTAQNILNQEFKNRALNEVWVSDMTELKYGINNEYSVKLSAVMDLHDGYILAWNLSTTETSAAAIQTFQRAFNEAGNVHPMVHTDRGSAYTSKQFNVFMRNHECERSMSRPGTPWDNIMMERYWNDFKVEWYDKFSTFDYPVLKEQVELGIDYFNNVRRSETRNGLTPHEMRYESVQNTITA